VSEASFRGLLSTLYFSYDNNGNLLSKADGTDTTIYEWDYEDRLLTVNSTLVTVNYSYDPDGNRISKTVDGVKTKYINDVASPLVQVLMETTEEDTVLATYTYGNDLISMNRAGENSYYHYDGLGSVRQLTDDNEAVVTEYTYDAFGNVIASTGTSENTYKFTGEQFDSSSGLLYLRARYYDSSIGRFISRDPILSPVKMESNFTWALPSLISRPQLLYPYIYCGNNPVNWIDPRGELIIVDWIYDCIQCFRYHGKTHKKASECRKKYPCDTQKRIKCNQTDPYYKKAMDHCTKCGIGSYTGS